MPRRSRAGAADRRRRPATRAGSQIDAHRRFHAAIDAAGPGLSDILWRVVCAGEGMRQAETALGWPARAGKLVLIALDRIADITVSAAVSACGARFGARRDCATPDPCGRLAAELFLERRIKFVVARDPELLRMRIRRAGRSNLQHAPGRTDHDRLRFVAVAVRAQGARLRRREGDRGRAEADRRSATRIPSSARPARSARCRASATAISPSPIPRAIVAYLEAVQPEPNLIPTEPQGAGADDLVRRISPTRSCSPAAARCSSTASSRRASWACRATRRSRTRPNATSCRRCSTIWSGVIPDERLPGRGPADAGRHRGGEPVRQSRGISSVAIEPARYPRTARYVERDPGAAELRAVGRARGGVPRAHGRLTRKRRALCGARRLQAMRRRLGNAPYEPSSRAASRVLGVPLSMSSSVCASVAPWPVSAKSVWPVASFDR